MKKIYQLFNKLINHIAIDKFVTKKINYINSYDSSYIFINITSKLVYYIKQNKLKYAAFHMMIW